jgi:hypothetical protein
MRMKAWARGEPERRVTAGGRDHVKSSFDETFSNADRRAVSSSPFFLTLLISQDQDGQPIVKFYRQHNAKHIYRLILRNKHFYVVCGRERSEKPPKSDRLEWYQKWQVVHGNQAF